MTTTNVLTAIKEMNSRQQRSTAPSISIDTLLLVLNTTAAELMPLIEELRMSRDITLHPGLSTRPSGSRRLATVSLN